MEISQIMLRMLRFSKGNLKDIDHFVRVWTYAKTIGELEQIDGETQYILEAAAITHDIACPFCREKYGNANGPLQETEGMRMVREFFSGTDLAARQLERIAFLVGHHHTYTDVDGMDYQILLEADYIVNAAENGYSRTNIERFMEKHMRTASGKELARQVLDM